MATTNSIKQQLKNNNTPVSKGKMLKDTLDSMAPEIARALPKHMDKDRMLRVALTAAQNTPKLFECDRTSFLSAIVVSSQLGLEPNTPLGHSYLIPYGNKVQFQIGYKGLLDLAFRSGMYQAIYAHEVYANDEFSHELGLNKDIKHIPADKPEGEPVGYYAVYKLKNGGFDFTYWSRDKVITHKRKYSKSNNGPWKDNFDGMAKKTVIIDVLKYAPKSIELAKAVESENKVIESMEADEFGELHFKDVTPEVSETEFDASEAMDAIEVNENGEIIEAEPQPLFDEPYKSKLDK